MAYTGRSIPEMNDEPTRVSSATSGSLDTLQAGQGAQVTTRKNADAAARRARASAERRTADRRLKGKNRPSYGSKRSDATSIDRRQMLILAGAALVVLIILGVLVSRACSSVKLPDAEQPPAQTAGDQPAQPVQPDAGTGAAVLQTIKYESATVTLERMSDGSYAVMAVGPDAANPITLFKVAGTPHSLLLHENTFIVPENLGGSWDVLLFTWGADAPVSPATGADGATIMGTGDIADAVFDGSVLHVSDTSGETTDIALD